MIAAGVYCTGQETADFRAVSNVRFVMARACAMLCSAVARSGTRAFASSDQSYPSLGRSACRTGGPVSILQHGIGGIPADIGYHGKWAIEFNGKSVDSGAVFEKLVKGKKPCRRNQSSSRPSRPSLCPLALKAIWNAASPVQAQAISARRSSAPIQPEQHLLAPLPACCATMRTFAVQHGAKPTALIVNHDQARRRRGTTPAAVLRFWGDR